jgi:hypothetical protein
MSDSDVAHVVDELNLFFSETEIGIFEVAGGIQVGPIRKSIRIENELTCPQLFDYYAKSLAG